MLFEQAVSIQASNFAPYVMSIAVQRVFVPRGGGTTDESRVAEAITALAGKLEGYERILGKQRYLAGDKLTIADLFHLPGGALLADAGVSLLTDENKYPNVSR